MKKVQPAPDLRVLLLLLLLLRRKKLKPAAKAKSASTRAMSKEEQDELCDWVQNHPQLYNKKLDSYRDSAANARLWAEKAKEMGYDVELLVQWYRSTRTAYSRLRKKQSGAHDFTEREEWIVAKLGFLRGHIIPKGGK